MEAAPGGDQGQVDHQVSATIEVVTPRNTRGPIGRSHHSATYYEAGRSLVVFGGYASAAGGHINELWVFNMDTMEWWQPDATGG